jgi:hypothetical protein
VISNAREEEQAHSGLNYPNPGNGLGVQINVALCRTWPDISGILDADMQCLGDSNIKNPIGRSKNVYSFFCFFVNSSKTWKKNAFRPVCFGDLPCCSLGRLAVF